MEVVGSFSEETEAMATVEHQLIVEVLAMEVVLVTVVELNCHKQRLLVKLIDRHNLNNVMMMMFEKSLLELLSVVMLALVVMAVMEVLVVVYLLVVLVALHWLVALAVLHWLVELMAVLYWVVVALFWLE